MNANRNHTPEGDADRGDFESRVLRSKQPVLVAFLAPWSKPCRILEAVLDELVGSSSGKVDLVKINADNNPDLSVWYGIESVPTLLYFVDGAVRNRIVGTASKEAILSKLAHHPGRSSSLVDFKALQKEPRTDKGK
jgi:thioredoxin 1